MISVDSLTKRFATTEAVRGLTFQVEKGEIVGLLGPNGAGKTTTMRMLTCFVAPTSGTAAVAGFDIYEQPLEVRRHIGYLPENVPLYGEMRVDEYLRFRARLKGVARSAIGPRLDSVADRCGLQEVRAKVIDHLSKGFRQRVGLAEALLHNPPILILDEPTMGLDPNQIRQVRTMIQELGREHTIILSSHILPEVEQVCARVVIIHRGRIVAQDRTDALSREVGGKVRIEVEVKGPRAEVLRALEALPGVLRLELPADAVRTPGTVRGHSPAGGRDDQALPAAAAAGEGETSPHSPRLGAALADGAAVRALVECPAGQDPREAIFNLAVARGWVLLGLSVRRRSLEEIFAHLTTSELPESAGSDAESAAPASAPHPEISGAESGPLARAPSPEGEGEPGDPGAPGGRAR